tara:strand:- start:1162 stop:1755 length:594 start_codon:yes stop_codon:yes gene_type:complete
MDQLLENPQAIFLLVFMAIAFLKFIGKNLKGENGESELENPSDPYDYEATREEILNEQRINGPPTVPSAEQAPRSAPQQLSILDFIVPVDTPAPDKQTPPPLPSANPTAASTPDPDPVPAIKPAPRPVLSPAETKALESLQKRRTLARPTQRTLRRRPIREQLATPSAARDAIILGEILGTPRGQQRFSQLGPLDNR